MEAWKLRPVSKDPRGVGQVGTEDWCSCKACTGDGALRVHSTQMVVVPVRVGEVAREIAHRTDISQRTEPWRTLLYKGKAE